MTRFTRAVRRSTLIAAAVAAAVPATPLMADVNGFTTGSGTGPTQYTLNGTKLPVAPVIDTGTNTLTITTAANDQASSAFYNTKQSVLNFTAEFDYTVTSPTPTADGFALVLQNDPRGATALGGGGGALGYNGGGAITNSVAMGADLYNNGGTSANPTRVGHAADGGGFAYASSAPVDLRSGATYHFKVQQDNGAFNATITNTADATQTFTAQFNRNIANRVGPTAFVGFTGATGGANAGQNISNFTFKTGTAPAAPAAGPQIAGVPQGGAGFFGVREVTNNNGVGNLTDVTDSLANNRSGTRRVVDYTAPSIDIFDSDDAAKGNFTNDRPFASAAAPGPGVGNVENLAMVATGTIRVPTAGTYTFAVKGDDGFRLSIGGQRFEVPLGQGGTAVNANGALEFNAGRGAGDISLGQIYLPAGDHPIQMLYWEGGGGSGVELSSAAGAQGGFNGNFNLVGAPAVAEVRQSRTRYTGTMGANDFTAGRINGIAVYGSTAQQLDALLNAARFERESAGTGSFNAVATANVVNFNDLGGGGGNPRTGGSITAPVEPPGGDPTTASDDYGVAVYGKLTIAAGRTGRYTFDVHADDDSIFRIVGPGGTLVPLVSTNRTAVDTDGDNVADAHRYDGCCDDSFGRYDLTTAGEYIIEAAFREGGGGSHFQLFGAIGDYNQFGDQFQLVGQDFNDTVNALVSPAVPAGLQLVAVPEPGTASALGLAALGMLAARRRRRSAR